MKEKAHSQHLTHRCEIFLGCNLMELLIIALFIGLIDIVLSVISSLFFNNGILFFLIYFVISFFLYPILAKAIGKVKENKQQGYLLLIGRKFLHDKFSFYSPFLTRTGRWVARKRD